MRLEEMLSYTLKAEGDEAGGDEAGGDAQLHTKDRRRCSATH